MVNKSPKGLHFFYSCSILQSSDLSSSVLRHLLLPLSLQKVIAEIQDLQHSPESIERYETKESVLSKKALKAFFQPWLFSEFRRISVVLTGVMPILLDFRELAIF